MAIADEIENKWILPNKTEDELKQIAKDLYNNKIFCDRHLSQYDRVESHFMVLLFMGPKQPEALKYPSDDSNLQGSRDNKLYDLAYKYAKASVEFNPSNFDAWKMLYYATNTPQKEKDYALSKKIGRAHV